MPLPKGKTAIIGLGKAKHTHNLHILSVLRQSSAVLDLCCTWCASFQDVCLGTCPSLPFYADRLHWKHIIHILKVSGWRQQKRKQASNTTLCSSAWVMRDIAIAFAHLLVSSFPIHSYGFCQFCFPAIIMKFQLCVNTSDCMF